MATLTRIIYDITYISDYDVYIIVVSKEGYFFRFELNSEKGKRVCDILKKNFIPDYVSYDENGFTKLYDIV